MRVIDKAVLVAYNDLGAIPLLYQKLRDRGVISIYIFCNNASMIDSSVRNELKSSSIIEMNIRSSGEMHKALIGIGFNVKSDVFICMQDRPMLA